MFFRLAVTMYKDITGPIQSLGLSNACNQELRSSGMTALFCFLVSHDGGGPSCSVPSCVLFIQCISRPWLNVSFCRLDNNPYILGLATKSLAIDCTGSVSKVDTGRASSG